MKLEKLEILENDFDLFTALDDVDKIEFLYDVSELGTQEAVYKHVQKLADKFIPAQKNMVQTEDFQVGPYRLCVTSYTDKITLNSNSLKAIKQFVHKMFNDGILLWPLKEKKTEYDIYRFFRTYQVVGRVGPFSEN
jgi:hypothetical protein|tara:strand:+ start:196 stop:603 length:408 start_codon:yes stop_codon:yes gene_type:complete